MKVRHGFVSNSSTTSFAIYGTWVRQTEAEDDEDFGDPDSMYDFAEKHGFQETDEGPDGDGTRWFIGYVFDNMRGDETKDQFMARTKEAVTKALPKSMQIDSKEFEWYVNGWNDDY